MIARLRIDADETLPFKIYTTYYANRTLISGQFGWGGTLLKLYQQGPKVDSIRSEIGCRVQEQKSA